MSSTRYRMSNILVTNLADTGKFNHVHITKEIGWKFLVVINMLVLAKMYHFILEKSDLKNLLIFAFSQTELAS